MIFIDWREFLVIALPITLTVLLVLLMWQAKRKPLWVRIITAIIATPLTLAALLYSGLLVLFLSIAHSDIKNSIPIHSPDGKRAARVETSGGGFGTTATTNVRIYSLHGLLSSWVYSGSEQSVQPADVRWLDDHTLEVRYTYGDGHTCDRTRNVHVICLPAGAPQH